MSNQIDLGDPGTATTFSFNMPMPDSNGGYVVVINESPYGLRFSIPLGNGTLVFKVPSDSWRQVTINGRISGPVQWSIVNNVNTSAAPLSDVVVECYGLNECPNVSMGVISRQTNLGNSIPVGTQATQVINDGASAPTLVVEGTPSGAPSSQLKWNNDGSGVFGGGNGAVSSAGILTLPASAVPVASIAAGNLPSGVKLPTAQLNAGALPSGVTLPASQLTGTLPASQVGSGYPGANVSGAVASATSATSAGSASSVPASGVSAGTFPGGAFTFPGSLTLGGDLTLQGGSDIQGISGFGGSGSATVNHGLGLTPRACAPNTFNNSNSTTFGSGSFTSSTLFLYQFNAQNWVCIAYV